MEKEKDITTLAAETTALIKLVSLHNDSEFKNSSLENMKNHIAKITTALSKQILKKTGSEKIDILEFQKLSKTDNTFNSLQKALYEATIIYEKTEKALEINSKLGTPDFHNHPNYKKLTFALKEIHLEMLKTNILNLKINQENLDEQLFTPEIYLELYDEYKNNINTIKKAIPEVEQEIKEQQKMFLDPDADGLTTGHEIQLGLNPYSRDSDGDGFDDKDELMQETNPMQNTENLEYRIVAKNNQYEIEKKHKILGWKSLENDKYKSSNLKDLDPVFSKLVNKQNKQNKLKL